MNRLAYSRFPGMGDLPGDSSNPNSPDYVEPAFGLDDAAAKRADTAWHVADLHDATYGDWTIGGKNQPVITVAEANRRHRAWLEARA